MATGSVRTRPHPWAWWGWALGVATASARVTNPLVIALVTGCVTVVILARRTDEPWARSVGGYFALAGFVLGIRLFFAILMSGAPGHTVLWTLPSATLPDWAAGIRLGGSVTAEPLAATTYDGLRLGLMLICLGAANALANPRRALKSVPAALYEVSVAIVVALSVAPQLVESTARIRRARRLRGMPDKGLRAMGAVALPVFGDAVDRSLALATSMEARGFGRTASGSAQSKRTTAILLVSMLAATLGGFWLLMGVPLAVALGTFAVGVAGTVVGLHSTGQRLQVTRYRPDPWTPRDGLLVTVGLLDAAFAAAATGGLIPGLADQLNPSTDPLVWPTLGLGALPLLVAALFPLAVTRPPEKP